MSLPIILQNGYILIYGLGNPTGISGLVPNDLNVKYGTVYQIWNGGELFIYPNQSVLFKEQDVYCRLAWAAWPYTLIQVAKLAGIETIPT